MMPRSRPSIAAPLTPPIALVFVVSTAACDLDHAGSVDPDEEATGGIVSTGGQATVGAGATGGLTTSDGGSEAIGGGGVTTTGGSASGGAATGGAGTSGEPNDPDCPTTEPTDGSYCTPAFGAPLECNYESVSCSCYGFGMGAQWTCNSANCPPTIPRGDELVCSGLEGTSCPYGSIECVCENGYWNCG